MLAIAIAILITNYCFIAILLDYKDIVEEFHSLDKELYGLACFFEYMCGQCIIAN